MKENATFSLSKEAIAMLRELYKQLIASTGSGSKSAVIEELIREAYERNHGND